MLSQNTIKRLPRASAPRAADSWKGAVPNERQPRKALQDKNGQSHRATAAQAREMSKEMAVKKKPRGDLCKGATSRGASMSSTSSQKAELQGVIDNSHELVTDLTKHRGKVEPLESLNALVSSWLADLDDYNRRMLSIFLVYQNKSNGIMAASTESAKLTEGNSECIRRWVKQAIENGTCDSSYNHHQLETPTTPWLLDNEEELQLKARCYIRKNAYVKGKPNMTARSFTEWVNEELLPHLTHKRDPSQVIHEDTERRWICRIGFTFKRHQKGVYFDGHERPDVIEARKEYIQCVTEVDTRSVIFGDFGQVKLKSSTWLRIPQIRVYHDETTFHAVMTRHINR